MAYQASEIIILNNDELYLLLAAAAVEGWYGPELRSAEEGPMDMDTVNRTLAGLYQKGIVDWNGDKIRISEELKEILKVIRASDICIMIRSERRQDGPVGCYTDGGKVVTVDGRAGGVNEIEVSIMSADEWMNSLERSGYYPETAGLPEEGEEEPSAPEEFVCEFELRNNHDGSFMQSATLYEKGLFGLISMETEKGSERKYFSLKRINKVLKGWIGEGQ